MTRVTSPPYITVTRVRARVTVIWDLGVTCVIALIMGVASCSPTPIQEQSFCGAAQPIVIAKEDKLTSVTLRSIIGHNEKGAKLCGWIPPK